VLSRAVKHEKSKHFGESADDEEQYIKLNSMNIHNKVEMNKRKL
jgi:hypothetical protein